MEPKQKQKEVLGLKLVGPDMRSGVHGRAAVSMRYAVGGSYTKKRLHPGPPQPCSADGFHFYQYTSNTYKFGPAPRDACVVLAVTARDHARGDRKSVARQLTVVKAIGVGTRAVHIWCKIHASRGEPGWPSSAAAAFVKNPSIRRLTAIRNSDNPVDVRLRRGAPPSLKQVHGAPLMPRRMNKVLLGLYMGSSYNSRNRNRADKGIDALHYKPFQCRTDHGFGPIEKYFKVVSTRPQ